MPCSRDDVTNQLLLNFSAPTVDGELLPLIHERIQKTYKSHVIKYISNHKTYGPKTLHNCLPDAVNEIVSYGEKGNGYIGQMLFENMQYLLGEAEEEPRPMDCEMVGTVLDYFVSSLHKQKPDLQYKTGYRNAYLLNVDLIKY